MLLKELPHQLDGRRLLGSFPTNFDSFRPCQGVVDASGQGFAEGQDSAIPGTSWFRSVCSSDSVLAESQSVRKWSIGDLSCSRECVLAKESLAGANDQRESRAEGDLVDHRRSA